MIANIIQASKIYETPAGKFTALEKSDLEIYEGELLLIIGPSGSGKTTLLSLIGCLIEPTEGNVQIDGYAVEKMSSVEMAKIRLNTIGFVFQQFNLLAPLTAEENVGFPLQIQGFSKTEIKQKTEEALAKVNMTEHRKKLPKQLSGGQQQRIAIARALISSPKIILCDEPTASLDKDSLVLVMQELKELAKSGKAVAIVTHDPRLIQYADRAIKVEGGKVYPIEDLSQFSH